jgi:hypothetical protein
VLDHALDNLNRFEALFRGTPHLVYYSTSPVEIKAIMAGVSPDMAIGNFHMPGLVAGKLLTACQQLLGLP